MLALSACSPGSEQHSGGKDPSKDRCSKSGSKTQNMVDLILKEWESALAKLQQNQLKPEELLKLVTSEAQIDAPTSVCRASGALGRRAPQSVIGATVGLLRLVAFGPAVSAFWPCPRATLHSGCVWFQMLRSGGSMKTLSDPDLVFPWVRQPCNFRQSAWPDVFCDSCCLNPRAFQLTTTSYGGHGELVAREVHARASSSQMPNVQIGTPKQTDNCWALIWVDFR